MELSQKQKDQQRTDAPAPRTLNQWVADIHTYAKAKGWWERPRSPLEIQMLVVSEIAEATECVRNSEPAFHFGWCRAELNGRPVPEGFIQQGEKFFALEPKEGYGKPEGEAVELADAVIRIMDYFGHMGWDLEAVMQMKHAYNQKRPYRHGGKAL